MPMLVHSQPLWSLQRLTIDANGGYFPACERVVAELLADGVLPSGPSLILATKPWRLFTLCAGSPTHPLLVIPPTAATEILGILYLRSTSCLCLGMQSLLGSFGLAGMVRAASGSPEINRRAIYQYWESTCSTVGFVLWCLIRPCLVVVSR